MTKLKRKPQKQIQPIFSRNADYRKTAFLNWRFQDYSQIQNLSTMGNGFMLAAIELASHSVKNNRLKIADILIFPVITNANHGIELYLKGITWALNRLHGSSSRVEGSHNLDQIFRTVKSKVNKWGGDKELKHFEKGMLHLSGYIEELSKKIGTSKGLDKMDFSRYPFSKDYKNHFYVECPGNEEVDLVNFISRFKKIHTKLEAYSDYLIYELENNQISRRSMLYSSSSRLSSSSQL